MTKVFRILYLKNKIRIYLSAKEDHKTLTKQFLNNEVHFFIYTPKDEIIYKIVLKAAHFTTIEEISEVLKENNITESDCFKLESNKNKSSSFLVSTKNNRLRQISSNPDPRQHQDLLFV